MKGIDIVLIEHKSARDIVTSYFEDSFSKRKSPSIKDIIVMVKQMKIWGYCDSGTNEKDIEIHYWIGEDVSKESAIEFLAHEVAHAYGIDDEDEAEKYAKVGRASYELLKKLKI